MSIRMVCVKNLAGTFNVYAFEGDKELLEYRRVKVECEAVRRMYTDLRAAFGRHNVKVTDGCRECVSGWGWH